MVSERGTGTEGEKKACKIIHHTVLTSEHGSVVGHCLPYVEIPLSWPDRDTGTILFYRSAPSSPQKKTPTRVHVPPLERLRKPAKTKVFPVLFRNNSHHIF